VIKRNSDASSELVQIKDKKWSNRRTKSRWQMHNLIVNLVGHIIDEAQKSREWLHQGCCILSAVRRCTQGAKTEHGFLI